MKICLINNLYGEYARGGAEKVVKTIADGLIKAGHDVFIITTKPYFKQLAVKNYGLRIYYLNSLYRDLNKLPKIIRLVWHLWDMFNTINYFKIKRILSLEKCDAVITNNLMGLGFLTPLLLRRLELKHVHLVHDIQLIHPSGIMLFGQENKINQLSARNYAGLCSRLFASPKAVIFPSRWLRDRHLDKIFFIKSKRVVLPNPVAPRTPGGFKKADNNFKFLYLGQIEKHKGLNLLIQAFKKIKEEFPQAELIIAGVGSEMEPAKVLAGEGRNIYFLGWQNEPGVNRLLEQSHCLVLPTLCYENCPAVILEAFSAGLPVLAADLGGISELLGQPAETGETASLPAKASAQAGLLFRPGNAADLADKMAWAISNQNVLAEMARAGKARADLGGVENYINELLGLMK